MADDLLSTLCLARACPLLVAPAMNREMWANPATQRNVEQLRADGIAVLGPAAGEQACGETGDGRMLEAHELLTDLIAFFQPKLLAGRHVLLTAGPTSEPVDPIRVLSNRSSGKTGYALARAAREAGARVTLVTGATALPVPRGVTSLSVTTARQMHDAVMASAMDADIFIAVAAVADWRVKNVSAQKLKKTSEGGGAPQMEFEPNPDILAEVARLQDGPGAWALPPRPKSWPSTPRPSACARASRCWWATWRRKSWTRTPPSWCCSMRRACIPCPQPASWTPRGA